MMNYNYEKDIKKHTPFEVDNALILIFGKIKYDLKNKTELIIIEQTILEIDKTLFQATLPLGYSFVELLNIDTNVLENAINKLWDLQIFTNSDITLEKYTESINQKYYMGRPKEYSFSFEFSEKKMKEVNDKNKYEFIKDIETLRRSIFDCLHIIAALHPYLTEKYCQDIEDTYTTNLCFIEHPELVGGGYDNSEIEKNLKISIIHDEWGQFIKNIIELISYIKQEIDIIKRFIDLAELCLNINRNDEWDDIPLYTRIYLANKFYNRHIDGYEITSIPDINIKNKSKKVNDIEKKYNNTLYDDEPFKPDIKELKSIYKDCLVSIEEETSLHPLWNVCFTSFMNMAKTETFVKKCSNCGKYFIPLNRSDTIYCDRPAPQDNSKTCKRYGGEKQYQANLKNDEVANRYRQTYMKLQMLVKRNPTITAYKNKFEEYKTLSKQWKLDVKNGKKTREEYLNWINTY